MAALRDTLTLLPMLVVIAGAVTVLLADTFAHYSADDDERPDGGRGWLAWLSVATVAIAGCLLCRAWDSAETPRALFGGMAVQDRFALFTDGLVLLGAGLSMLLSARYLHAHRVARGEWYALVLLACAGMMVMAHAADLLLLFIGLETMSVAVYALAGYLRGDDRSAEAGLKYFLLGAFASTLLLYGIALVWGATGSTSLHEVARALAESSALTDDPIVFVGMLLILAGMAFKVGMVPFHMWTPDVYEGSPAPATSFMASSVKAAGFAVFVRVLTQAFFEQDLALSPGAGGAPVGWFQILVWLAIATMVVGNVAAVLQRNVKRMLAYSSVAHAGYAAIAMAAMVPLASGQPAAAGAASAVLWYMLAYGVATVGAFGAVALIQREGVDLTDVRDLHGLAQRHPALALGFTVCLLSLGGLPPTGGFIAKLQVFREALAAGDALTATSTLAQGGDILYQLVVIGALNSVVAVVYYLRPVVAMYMRSPRDHWRVLSSPSITLALATCVALTLWLGLFPDDTIALAHAAAAGLLP